MKRSTAMILLIGSQLIYVVSLIGWLFVLGMSAMGFDDPKAMNSVMLWLILAYILVYPAAVLISAVAAWIKFARGRLKAALIWNAVPLLWLVPLLVLLFIVFLS